MNADKPYEELATAAQAAMFFAEQKGITSCAYNLTTVVDVTGDSASLDAGEVFRRLADATPALRLRMGLDEWSGEVAYGFSRDKPEVVSIDLDGADPEAVRVAVDEVAQRPFDADGGALARFLIVRTAADRVHLAVICHHLCVDGISHARLASRLGNAVEGPVPTEEEREYVGLVRDVRALEQQAMVGDLDYWRRRVPAGFSPAVWRDGLAGEPASGLSLTPLDDRVVRRLGEAAQADQVRPFHILMAAVHSALPLVGDGPSVVSTAVSTRPLAQKEARVTGCFINEVPLQAGPRSAATPRGIAVREGPGWREDLRRRYIPFTQLVGRAKRRDGDQSQLDTVIVSYRKSPRRLAWSSGGLEFAADLYPKFLEEKTDLVIRFFHYGDSMECDVQWGQRMPEGLGDAFARDLLTAMDSI